VSCLFCQIAEGHLPADKVFEDADVVAFRDIRPVAPTHILVVPRRHITNLETARPEDWPLIAECLKTAVTVARQQGLAPDGFRVVANTGRNGGQTVDHLHWHILGGRLMTWPPG
jgi:histidine triad (HIT) family protein